MQVGGTDRVAVGARALPDRRREARLDRRVERHCVHRPVAAGVLFTQRACEALPYLLHGNETRVWGDQGYQGQTAVIHARAPNAKDFTNRGYRYHGRVNEVEKAKNRHKSRVRAKVEHVFGVIKNIFGFRKTRYRGLAKNLNRLEVTAALANLYLVRRRLLKA